MFDSVHAILLKIATSFQEESDSNFFFFKTVCRCLQSSKVGVDHVCGARVNERIGPHQDTGGLAQHSRKYAGKWRVLKTRNWCHNKK